MVSDGARDVKRPGGIQKMKKLQKPRMQTMAEMRMRRKLHSACAVNKHCCCSSELFCILWCPDAQVPPASVTLMPHYRFNFIMFCNQSVVAAGYSTPSEFIWNTPATSTSDPNSFPNCCKILKLYWFTRGIFQILLRRLFGLLSVGALEKDLQSWKRCFVWFVISWFWKREKIKQTQ